MNFQFKKGSDEKVNPQQKEIIYEKEHPMNQKCEQFGR